MRARHSIRVCPRSDRACQWPRPRCPKVILLTGAPTAPKQPHELDTMAICPATGGGVGFHRSKVDESENLGRGHHHNSLWSPSGGGPKRGCGGPKDQQGGKEKPRTSWMTVGDKGTRGVLRGRRAQDLPDEQRERKITRPRRARALIGSTDAQKRFDAWRAPEER
jgi:hypothetical protein